MLDICGYVMVPQQWQVHGVGVRPLKEAKYREALILESVPVLKAERDNLWTEVCSRKIHQNRNLSLTPSAPKGTNHGSDKHRFI